MCARPGVSWRCCVQYPLLTCAAEEGVSEVRYAERGHRTDDGTHEPTDACNDSCMTQSHMTELERVEDGHQSLQSHDGQHEDGHLAV